MEEERDGGWRMGDGEVKAKVEMMRVTAAWAAWRREGRPKRGEGGGESESGDAKW